MELINKIEDQFINILSQNIGVSEINAGYLYALIRTLLSSLESVGLLILL